MVAVDILLGRGSKEGDKLTRALIAAAADGLRPHCSDAGTGGLWLSEIQSERSEAAKLCRGCVVIVECGAAADARQEKFGTWGGRDRTRATSKPAAA